MTAEVISQPNQGDGLDDVSTDGDEEDGEIANGGGKGSGGGGGGGAGAGARRTLTKKNNIPNTSDENTDNDKPETVPEPVCQDGDEEGDDGSDEPDRDRVDLASGAGVAEGVDDGGDEEGGCVAGDGDA